MMIKIPKLNETAQLRTYDEPFQSAKASFSERDAGVALESA